MLYGLTGGFTDVAFYASLWTVSTICGALSTFIGHRYDSFWDVFATGILAGFVSISVVGLVARAGGATDGNEPYYLGIAIAVGITGRQSLRLSYFLVNSVLKKAGVESEWDDQESE